MSQNLHPAFHAAMASIVNAGTQLQGAKRKAYVQALKVHDWHFEFSDDHAVYSRGREALAQLKLAARELDPDHVLWNEHAPAAHRVGVAA